MYQWYYLSYVFIKISNFGFAIVAVYVGDINLVWTPEELNKTTQYLKNKFNMKDLRKQNIVLVYKSSIVLMEF